MNINKEAKALLDDKNNQIQQLSLPLSYVSPNEHSLLRLAQEFATAKYTLSPNELKAWILFISSLGEPEREGVESLYVFNAIDFADKLGIDPRKARGREVAELFVRLSKNEIDLRSREDERGEQDIFHSHFISSVNYRKDTYRLEVSIPTGLRPYLFALKTGTFINIIVSDVLALNTVAALRVFLYCKNLERIGRFTVTIEEMKEGTGFMLPSYEQFKEFKRNVLQPAVKEIRKHTEYKNFYIEDNGGRGRKATHLHFGFDPTFDSEDLFLNTSKEVATAIIKKFSPLLQISIRVAMDNGFNPRYIKDKFDNIPEDVIKANFMYVEDIISREKKEGNPKTPDVYGKYYIKAVIENWALKNEKFDEMKKKTVEREKNQELQKRMKETQERDDAANINEFYRTKAKEYLETMDFATMDNFIRSNLKGLNAMSGKSEFNYEHAVSCKKNYREYRILVDFITAKMTLREIEVPGIFNSSHG